MKHWLGGVALLLALTADPVLAQSGPSRSITLEVRGGSLFADA